MSAIGRYLRSRSDTAEFLFVFIVAWLPNIAIGAGWLVLDLAPAEITADALIEGLAFELVILAILFPILCLRGWTWARLGMRLRPLDLALGLGVALVLAVLFQGIEGAIALTPAGERMLSEMVSISADLPVGIVLVFSLVNAIFEEALLCGYIIGRDKERNRAWRGVWATVAIRALCHLYQGWLGGAEVSLMGIAFGWAYVRTGRLWPLILGHALYDTAVLLGWIN